ncbi:hypothetical protein GW891_05335, partial [bacterium]|nr:hypothetical protein [bacterium]
SHQLSFNHLSQITVSTQFSSQNTNSACASIRAFFISFIVAFGLANLRFSSIDRLKSELS